MNAPAKLVAFGAGLAVLFGGGALAGAAIGPDRDEQRATASDRSAGHEAQSQEHSDASRTEATESAAHGGHASGAAEPQPVRGLAVAENGLRLVVAEPELRRGRAERLVFRIADERGATVRDFDVEHTKRMHVIVARRDLTGFQHVHPEQRADGSWQVPVTLTQAGSYRVFADFSHEGEAQTLATDLRVDGQAQLRPLPVSEPTAVSDGGYDVRLDAGGAQPGQEAELRFTISKGGVPVHTEPYLGAGGHLVALREGDLAFLHVHPTEHGDKGDEHDDSVGFAATFPSEGRYRLFLQFKHEGRVQTVAFTQEVK